MPVEAVRSAWAAVRFEGTLALVTAPMLLAWSLVGRAKQELMFHMTSEGTQSSIRATNSAALGATAKRILIVEDQPALREILVQVLEREDYLVDAAGCLVDARLALLVHEYDLLVLDLVLPDGSGYSLLSWLKDYAACPRPRVLVLSRLTEVDDLLIGLCAGIDDYIGKPFEFDDLLHSVARLLE